MRRVGEPRRYYAPGVGGFINADDITYLDPSSLASCNVYGYCGNNPVMYVDPTGRLAFLFSFLIGLGVAAAIGAGIGAVSYVASEAITWATTGEWNWS